MPICRNCGARIEKFNQDMCPVCGAKNPLEGVKSDTIEITSEISGLKGLKSLKIKKNRTFKILSIFLSPLGINFIYIKKYLLALILALVNIAVFLGVFLPLIMLNMIDIVIATIIPILICYILSNVSSILLFNHICKRKDGNGNFLI